MTAPRTFAYRALRQVLEAGQMTDEALTETKLAALPTRDRGFVRALLMAALRDYGRIKKLLWPWLKTPAAMPPEVWAMLVLGAAQLLILKTPPHAAVNETLELAARENMVGFKGLLNALLRRVDREGRVAFDKIPLSENYPAWLRNSWKNFPDAEKFYDVFQSEPPLDLTVPQNIENWAERLQGEVITPQTIRLSKDRHPRESGDPGNIDRAMDSRFRGNDVTKLDGYEQGAWWVQDVAAAMPVALLGDLKTQNVLELCAAPGGKTMQLLAAGANVTAIDSSAQRLVSLNENLRRMKFTADVQCADVMRYETTKQFDVVVLDAPCSATGTLRRHPEIVLHRQEKDIDRLSKLQHQMITRAADWVKPGGKLLYVVCSLQIAEGEEQVKAFLAARDQFSEVSRLRVLPTMLEGGADGFFAALLAKSA